MTNLVELSKHAGEYFCVRGYVAKVLSVVMAFEKEVSLVALTLDRMRSSSLQSLKSGK